MIRVVYAIDAPYLGGAEHYVSRLATGLDRREFAPALIMPTGGVDASLKAWAGGLESAGIPVVRVPMRLPFRAGDAIGIYRALASFEPHIVHVNMPGPYTGQTGLLIPIARAAGARVVVTEHLPMVERLWKRAAVKEWAVRFADAAVTMSHANARLMVQNQGYAAGRVQVVENGVPSGYGMGGAVAGAPHDTAPETGIFTFGFVGNLIPHKGLRLLIEAVSTLVESWRLVVVGEGPDEADARHIAMRRGVADRVVFLGRRSPEDVERLIGACDAIVLPSSVEGLPYVILEAMACAKPVVSTKAFGIPEAVIDGVTGILVEPGDVAALSHALHTLMTDARLCARLGRAGRERFEAHFTLERQIDAMSALYRGLATGRATRVGSSA